MVTIDGIVQVLDALTGRLITKAEAEDVSAEVVYEDKYKDVTNYRWLANQLNITVQEAVAIYGKE
tara:strand:+ start:58 stop:252 length:195 start_codon:yes stop_codon:yes gene_type:complete